MSAPWIKGWMGKYPRKGADWSPEEDQALIREYESGRYLNKDIAAMHMREPVAIERRLDSLRRRRDIVARYEQMRSWASERETARQAVSKIKGEFAAALWPRCRQDLRKIKVGDIVGGRVVTAVHEKFGAFMLSRTELSDLPPEVAQAIQFGGEE